MLKITFIYNILLFYYIYTYILFYYLLYKKCICNIAKKSKNKNLREIFINLSKTTFLIFLKKFLIKNKNFPEIFFLAKLQKII
jgi:hypothetical protein